MLQERDIFQLETENGRPKLEVMLLQRGTNWKFMLQERDIFQLEMVL